MKTAVVADTTCDLSQELLDRYEIRTIPLHVYLGEQEYRDGVDITPEMIYSWSDENRATPRTSAITPEEAVDFLKDVLEDADDVIYFSISSDMSACSSVMSLAAETIGCAERVHVIDGMNLSTGTGLLVVRAAVLAQKGVPAEEIVRDAEKARPLVRASFVVDTMQYLYRGGRCSGLTALVGSTLKIHPMIAVTDGKMHPGKKYRGKIEKVILHYVEDLLPEIQKANKDRIFITHSGCDPKLVEEIRRVLSELQYFDEICITRAGSVITSHCGPGTLGVLFVASE